MSGDSAYSEQDRDVHERLFNGDNTLTISEASVLLFGDDDEDEDLDDEVDDEIDEDDDNF